MSKAWVIKPAAREGKRDFSYERDLHDPFLLKDLDRAVGRIGAALATDEKILIFADYDADGVPGAAILASFFKQIGFKNFKVYLPDRHKEDYGLSEAVVRQAATDGVGLIITIDCGIANARETALAQELGVDVIVTDHHLVPAGGLPPARAVVNPKRADCAYPYKMLCGAGVVFKLVQGLLATVGPFSQVLGNNPQTVRKWSEQWLAGRASESFSSDLGIVSEDPRKTLARSVPLGWEKWLLDLVAIATVSDMVPLTGENRALVYFGLKVLRRSPRPGLQQLCRELGLTQEFLTEDDIGFSIGPRLNSASRMAHADEAFELLTTNHPVRAGILARKLQQNNLARRAAVDRILQAFTTTHFSRIFGNNPQITQKVGGGSGAGQVFLHSLGIVSEDLQKNLAESLPPLIVAGGVDWPLGVLGLAASRLVESCRQPVFVWGQNGQGLVKGSCRSDGTVQVVELMEAVNAAHLAERGEAFFANIGGHAQAGGFSLPATRVGELASRLAQAYAQITKQTVADELALEAELALDAVTDQLEAEWALLGPFGLDNRRPVFWFRNVVVQSLKKFGQTKNHLELSLVSATHSNAPLKAISFFNQFPELDLNVGSRVELAATLEKSYFRSTPRLRLRIVDLRRAG